MRKAIIAAGGRSSRFHGVNKCLLPLNGKPILFNIIELCKKNHVEEIAVVVSLDTYQDIIKFLKNGEDFDVNICYFIQDDKQYGLPVAIKSAKSFLSQDDDVLVVCSDNYFQIDLSKAFEIYRSKCVNDGKILVSCKSIEKQNAVNFAVFNPNKNEFLEKPTLQTLNNLFSEESNVDIFAGPLIMDLTNIERISELSLSQRNEIEIVHLINMCGFEKFMYDGIWIDIGNPISYAKAIINH
jgi:NDP-sugar pyrophosphorylase family protein